MLDFLSKPIVAVLATYFQVSDLDSVSKTSTSFRHIFANHAWSKIFVVPEMYSKHANTRYFYMYEYQVIDEPMLINPSQ